jgi:oxygen-dependent protoporphyrinogen oxidase
MGMEWFHRASGAARQDQSVAEFVRSHYGQEAVDYLAEPLLAGVYGGDPGRLSVGSVLPRFIELEARYGSLTRGVLHERRKAAAQARGVPLFRTLRGGLGQLVDALETAARPAVIHGAAEQLVSAGHYRVRVNGDWIEAQSVVLACPAYEAAALLAGPAPELAGLLAAIPYSHSITLALGYERARLQHPLNGFGFLVPRLERRRLVACTWVGTKFSERVPDHLAVLRCFLGGEDDAVLAGSDDELVAAARAELRDIMGVDAEPLFVRLARWPRSMAQYTVGHARRLEEIEARLQQVPGLHLAGNAYQGIGIPDCVRMGKRAAEAIAGRYVG